MKKIERDAFSGCSSVSTFVLPQSLQFIGTDCFRGCGSVRTVVLERGAKLGRDGLEDSGLGSGVEIVFQEQRKLKAVFDLLLHSQNSDLKTGFRDSETRRHFLRSIAVFVIMPKDVEFLV